EVEAIEAGQHDVEEAKVEAACLERFQAAPAIGTMRHAVVVLLEVIPGKEAQCFVVFGVMVVDGCLGRSGITSDRVRPLPGL
ncbi:hypothetical protein NK909_24870, partial [Salmonella enterica subsp. enterica serovar Typhimurium]